jgi:hypothetical protein
MNFSICYWRLSRWLTAAFITGLVLGFFGRSHEIPVERLGDQSFQLVKIAEDAMLYRATPKRIAERVERELDTKVEWEVRTDDSGINPQKLGVVVLPAETGFGSMGGRWILIMKVAEDGRCEQVWLEMQPVGFL